MDASFGGEPGEQLLEALLDEAIDRAIDLADARVARRLHADLQTHDAPVGGLLAEVVVAELRQRLHEVGCGRHLGEALGELGAIALGEAGDQVFLRVEVDVERAGADRRLLADVLHGGAMETGAREAELGGVEDVLAAGALGRWFQFRHGGFVSLVG